MKNASKTRVHFGWRANGGFLEGAGWVDFPLPRLMTTVLAALVNLVPILKGIDIASIGRTVRISDGCFQACVDIQ
jgi:hypothetical protein